MKALAFIKMEGSGNDFIVIDNRQPSDVRLGADGLALPKVASKLCDRKYGIGADGLLVLEKSKKADSRMRVFNADGSEAEMCGNGARCCALYLSQKDKKKKIILETKAGILEAEIKGKNIKLKITDPSDLKLGMRLNVAGKEYEVSYLNTGVPHAVVEVDDIKRVPVGELGPKIRHHEAFHPAGSNVDFVKYADKDRVFIRTYERGVEDETLACGTGSVAGAIIATLNHSPHALGKRAGGAPSDHKVFVRTKGGERLGVYFKISKYKITDVWLEGDAKIVYRGEYYV